MDPVNPTLSVRDIVPAELRIFLRSMLGLDPETPASGEQAADLRRPLPPTIEGLDAGAWIAWCKAGLVLFAETQPGRLPGLRATKRTAARVLVSLAMLRSGGSIARASAAVGISRKVLRDNLRRFSLYPWQEDDCDSCPGEGR